MKPARDALPNGGQALTNEPWGFGLVTGRLPAAPPAYVRVELDPRTQRAVFLDTAGAVVEMAKHGTNKTSGTASLSGGGDGANPAPQVHDDHTTDYSPD